LSNICTVVIFYFVVDISVVTSEESSGVQPSVSDVALAAQRSVAVSGKSPETRKKHAKKLHKRKRKAGMHWT